MTAGVVALGIAAAILRGFGRGYRIGRLLAVAPRLSVAEAVQLAESGRAGYVRIEGRIDSEAEWEDADHRPLVLRRTTFDHAGHFAAHKAPDLVTGDIRAFYAGLRPGRS